MELLKIIEGLQLIQKSKPENATGHFRAEHDEIFVGSLNWRMSEEDKKRIKELGWEACEDADGWRACV